MEHITGNFVLYRQVQCKLTLISCVGRLKSLELGYTGLDNAELRELLPTIGQLEELHYLGLSGNRLDKDIVDVLMQVSHSNRTQKEYSSTMKFTIVPYQLYTIIFFIIQASWKLKIARNYHVYNNRFPPGIP